MAASPQWKVYAGKEYVAACKSIEDAACLVAFRGDGATIRAGHAIVVWTEGSEDQDAHESYDHVAETALRRLDEHRAKCWPNVKDGNTLSLGELRRKP